MGIGRIGIMMMRGSGVRGGGMMIGIMIMGMRIDHRGILRIRIGLVLGVFIEDWMGCYRIFGDWIGKDKELRED